MSQKQRQIFTSTPHKRTYLYNTGQGILKSQQSQTRNHSESVNPAASRVYRVVLWSSENTERTSKKTKKTDTTTNKQQKEKQCADSQNPDKEDSLNSGTCDKSQLKTGNHFGKEEEEEEENKKPKVSRHERRNKYKLEVNKEIQKWFSQNFHDNNKKDSHHPRNQGRVTEKIKCLDRKALKVCQKNYKRSSRDARTKNKDKCEDDLFSKSGDHIDEDAEDCHHTDDSKHLDTDEDDSSKNNEAGDLFDIWDLSEDKNPDSLNLSKDKNTKTKNKSRSNKTQREAKNEKTVPKLLPLNSSQIYEFPQSPDADKSRATHNKSRETHNKSKVTPGKSNTKTGKSSKKKKNLKDDLVVNEILNVISKTKIEIESMKAKILKQKTKYK